MKNRGKNERKVNKNDDSLTNFKIKIFKNKSINQTSQNYFY